MSLESSVQTIIRATSSVDHGIFRKDIRTNALENACYEPLGNLGLGLIILAGTITPLFIGSLIGIGIYELYQRYVSEPKKIKEQAEIALGILDPANLDEVTRTLTVTLSSKDKVIFKEEADGLTVKINDEDARKFRPDHPIKSFDNLMDFYAGDIAEHYDLYAKTLGITATNTDIAHNCLKAEYPNREGGVEKVQLLRLAKFHHSTNVDLTDFKTGLYELNSASTLLDMLGRLGDKAGPVVNLACKLKIDFLDKVPTLDPDKPIYRFSKDLMDLIVYNYANRLPSTLNSTDLCFAFDSRSGHIVLKLNSGADDTTIKLFHINSNTFGKQGLSDKVMQCLPRHWFGNPTDVQVIEHISLLSDMNTPYFKDNYKTFLGDADRCKLNAYSVVDIQELIANSIDDLPDFVSEAKLPLLDSPDEKKAGLQKKYAKNLNAFLTILNQVSPTFTIAQKDVFFRLFCQTASPCPGGVGMNNEVFAVGTGQNTSGRVEARGKDLMLTFTSEHSIKSVEDGQEEEVFASHRSEARFLVNERGNVTEVIAKISEPILERNKNLSFKQKLALSDYVENMQQLEQVYIRYAAKGMTVSEQI